MNMSVETLVDPIAEHAQAMLAHLGEEVRRPGLTEQVADALVQLLEPRGVIVLAEARHLCMAMRGVQKQHSTTVTRALRGAYAHDAAARQEVLSMIQER
jgi:GTP cyclohydrolase I